MGRPALVTAIAANQVLTAAPKPTAAPADSGLRYVLLAPRMLAVRTASTRMVSKPSRSTRMPLSSTTAR
jgi:hypothetical protein